MKTLLLLISYLVNCTTADFFLNTCTFVHYNFETREVSNHIPIHPRLYGHVLQLFLNLLTCVPKLNTCISTQCNAKLTYDMARHIYSPNNALNITRIIAFMYM